MTTLVALWRYRNVVGVVLALMLAGLLWWRYDHAITRAKALEAENAQIHVTLAQDRKRTAAVYSVLDEQGERRRDIIKAYRPIREAINALPASGCSAPPALLDALDRLRIAERGPSRTASAP